MRDVHVRRAFSRLPRCILLPFWLEFDSRSSEWRSRGILAATRCSRMQSRKSPLIETMSKEGNDNAVLLSLLPLFVLFSPPIFPRIEFSLSLLLALRHLLNVINGGERLHRRFKNNRWISNDGEARGKIELDTRGIPVKP